MEVGSCSSSCCCSSVVVVVVVVVAVVASSAVSGSGVDQTDGCILVETNGLRGGGCWLYVDG